MRKNALLKQVFGYDDFRPGQEALIDALLCGRDALGVMPTGSGKSICYQLPALMLEGIALVVSPLISLMKDQVTQLKQAGVAAAYINSSLTQGQQQEALRRAALYQYRIVYVAPERLFVPEFLHFAQTSRLSLIAVDEAHCVSQWGQDFRPSYLKINEFIGLLPTRPPVCAFTATATERVRLDMVKLLALNDPVIAMTGFDRPNLRFSVIKPKDRFMALMEVVGRHKGENGIVYCTTRKSVEEVTRRLLACGVKATRYHAGLSDAERKQNQEDFLFDNCNVMVATNAFGMGIDKSDVRYVIHYNMPKSIEAYYQEAGRAGRDGASAECVLLYGGQDVMTARWMIEHTEPNPELTQDEQALVREQDMERLKRMTFYATSRRCLRGELLAYFGEQQLEPCGNCSVCLGEAFEQGQARAAVKPKAPKSANDKLAADDPMFMQLKALRRELSLMQRVPAFVVFTDATLQLMAARKPRNEEELMAIPGVGQAKCERYGRAFLDELAGRSSKAGEKPLSKSLTARKRG